MTSLQVAQLQKNLDELQSLLLKRESFTCCSETIPCQDIKIGLEIEIHQTNESIDQTELKLKEVELESKNKLEQLQDLKKDLFFFIKKNQHNLFFF